MKLYEFRLKFHWSLFLRVHKQYSNIGSDNGLAPGDKPLTEPKMVSLVTHIRITRPQWVNLCGAVPVYACVCYHFDTQFPRMLWRQIDCTITKSYVFTKRLWYFDFDEGTTYLKLGYHCVPADVISPITALSQHAADTALTTNLHIFPSWFLRPAIHWPCRQSKLSTGSFEITQHFRVSTLLGTFGKTRSIQCLLMTWLLASPGHQQP